MSAKTVKHHKNASNSRCFSIYTLNVNSDYPQGSLQGLKNAFVPY